MCLPTHWFSKQEYGYRKANRKDPVVLIFTWNKCLAVQSQIMVMAVFSLKFCRLRGQMQTLEWLKNDFHFVERYDEVINHVEFELKSRTEQRYSGSSVNGNSCRWTAILMATFTKPPFNSLTNFFFFIFAQGDNTHRWLRTLQGLRVRV